VSHETPSISAVSSSVNPPKLLNSKTRSHWEVPFEVIDRWILVKGSIGEMKGLTFQIDTVSTSSLIDRKAARKPGLQPGGDEHRLQSFGKVSNARRVEPVIVRMGEVSASLRCLEADLSSLAVDGLIGLDVLRRMDHLINVETGEAPPRKTFTIDFSAGKVRFGESMSLDHLVCLEPDSNQVIVTAQIQGHRIRLSLDTGTGVSVLFQGLGLHWMDALPIAGYRTGTRLRGGYVQKEVLLRDFILGTARCNDMSSIVSEARNQPTNGLLSVLQLGPKVLHLDSTTTS
jgi:hypothetical protein